MSVTVGILCSHAAERRGALTIGTVILVPLGLVATLIVTLVECWSEQSSGETQIQIEINRKTRRGRHVDPMPGAIDASDDRPSPRPPGNPPRGHRLSKPLTIPNEIAPGSDNRKTNEADSSETG